MAAQWKTGAGLHYVCEFRTGRTKEAVEGLFYQFVLCLKKMGETEHDEVFIDGTKLESQANRYTFVWRKTTEKYLAKVKACVREEFTHRGVPSNVTLKKLRGLVKSKKASCEKAGILFVHGTDRRKPLEQRAYEKLLCPQYEY